MPERIPAIIVSKDTGFRYYGNVWGDRVCVWTSEDTATRMLADPPVSSDYQHIASLERHYNITQLARIEQ